MAYPPQPPTPAPAPTPPGAVFQQPAMPAAPAPAAPAPAAAAPAAAAGESGFPENTPLAEMTADQQVAYWKHKSRKHEDALKNANLDELQRQAQELAQLKAATQSDQEKAIEAARAEGRAQALQQTAGQLVDAYFAAATANRMTDEQRTTVLAGMDRKAFLAADGISVDVAKVTAFVDQIAPAATTASPGAPGAAPPRLDMGQGRTPPTGRPVGLEAGRAEARRRFPAPATTPGTPPA